MSTNLRVTKALKRAGSSDLTVMQESGYYQRDKTRWGTLYWTVTEIIQWTLAIIPWHSFVLIHHLLWHSFFAAQFQGQMICFH